MNKNQIFGVWNSIQEMMLTQVKYQQNREYGKLVELYDKQLEFCEDGRVKTSIFFEKIYCLIRLNKKVEAMRIFNQIKRNGYLAYINEDTNFQVELIFSFFMENEANQLPLICKNTLKAWLKSRDSYGTVFTIVFDYQDIIGEVEVFSEEWAKTRHNTYSIDLLKAVFHAMQRDNDEILYYDRHKNDVLIYEQDYLVSILIGREQMNKVLAKRITTEDSYDSINEGVHFLVPQISIIEYIAVMKQHSGDFSMMLSILESMQEGLTNHCKEEDININSYTLNMVFFQSLNMYLSEQETEVDSERVNAVINASSEFVARRWLSEINEIAAKI